MQGSKPDEATGDSAGGVLPEQPWPPPPPAASLPPAGPVGADPPAAGTAAAAGAACALSCRPRPPALVARGAGPTVRLCCCSFVATAGCSAATCATCSRKPCSHWECWRMACCAAPRSSHSLLRVPCLFVCLAQWQSQQHAGCQAHPHNLFCALSHGHHTQAAAVAAVCLTQHNDHTVYTHTHTMYTHRHQLHSPRSLHQRAQAAADHSAAGAQVLTRHCATAAGSTSGCCCCWHPQLGPQSHHHHHGQGPLVHHCLLDFPPQHRSSWWQRPAPLAEPPSLYQGATPAAAAGAGAVAAATQRYYAAAVDTAGCSAAIGPQVLMTACLSCDGLAVVLPVAADGAGAASAAASLAGLTGKSAGWTGC